MSLQKIDLERQSQDGSLNKAKLKADFLDGSNLDLTGGNNDAGIVGLAPASVPNGAVIKSQMESAISAALVGGMTYKGVIDASALTGETLDGSKAGDYYYVSVAGNLDSLDFQVKDHLVVNADITDFSVDGAGKIDKVDNTESDDIIRDADIKNNLTTSVAGSVLDASQGKILKDKQDLMVTEINSIESGAGLAADGSYNQPSGSNYIDAATSLANADSLLDSQAKANADAIAAFGTEVYGEKPVVSDGVAVLPALSNIPVKAGTARIYLNGMRQDEGAGNDYVINETTGVITFNFNLKAPNKDKVQVDYKY